MCEQISSLGKRARKRIFHLFPSFSEAFFAIPKELSWERGNRISILASRNLYSSWGKKRESPPGPLQQLLPRAGPVSECGRKVLLGKAGAQLRHEGITNRTQPENTQGGVRMGTHVQRFMAKRKSRTELQKERRSRQRG